MANANIQLVVVGNFVHISETNCQEIAYLHDHIMIVNTSGKIVFFDRGNLTDLRKEYQFNEKDILAMTSGQFMIPGLIDTRATATCFPMACTHMDKKSFDWLENCALPAEAQCFDLNYTERLMQKLVKCMVDNGTTTACYLMSMHFDACSTLANITIKKGQRAIIGKTCMDRNSPYFYFETSNQAYESTVRLVRTLRSRVSPLLMPVLVLRLRQTTTEKLVQKFNQLSKDLGICIQTTMAQSAEEVKIAFEMFPNNKTYTSILDKASLLTPRTILAHCIHVTEEDIQLLKDRNVGVSHCPNSNISIRSGIFDARKFLKYNVNVGLGTDIGAGYSVSILNAIRMAITTSKIISIGKVKETAYQPISNAEAFCMATLGGAKVLGLDKRIGNFQTGKDFDALLIDCNVDNSVISTFDFDGLEEKFQRFLYAGDDRNIINVYVAGKSIKSN
ncbi:uncharacterized protein TRIADDRAFT_53262 [Trichoplax adhaerens]|uniref:Amidohydrolase-related domain-containing protein n=1 Tax=Trichoplax adhaerens TaxID=10228 RepID=B3RNR7_TRIAD|nr:hypothetical protein TRIADDRAFT_53262 [Trichoplax adhaerens]EDV28060.1 hypothetical protein TRIADDRAFT_53262 [Trichoplax adhaerens]|eukprot:XP_002109894.1 hypothetical protein TRIADDRAFT_53262 [Trichoplax adhaerens]